MLALLSVRTQILPEVLYLEFTSLEEVYFQPGQFFQLTLKDPPNTDSRGNTRTFGFVNSPNQNHTVAMITKNGVSSFKTHLQEMPLGTEVEIGNIGGSMTVPEDLTKPLVFVTSDIGIAPYLSIIKYMGEMSLPYQLTLVNIPPLLLTSSIQGIKTYTPDSLDTYFLKNQFPTPANHLFYISGVPHFVTNSVRILHDFGLSPTQIKFEVFSGY